MASTVLNFVDIDFKAGYGVVRTIMLFLGIIGYIWIDASYSLWNCLFYSLNYCWLGVQRDVRKIVLKKRDK